jgi:hypothetical protein
VPACQLPLAPGCEWLAARIARGMCAKCSACAQQSCLASASRPGLERSLQHAANAFLFSRSQAGELRAGRPLRAQNEQIDVSPASGEHERVERSRDASIRDELGAPQPSALRFPGLERNVLMRFQSWESVRDVKDRERSAKLPGHLRARFVGK